ncbi:hypothetical protein GCM10009098_17490 [Rheinheimera aquimaris]|uniref:Uncharacterized protein n=1 Tax=Rheinheimera aquimaris TaxID=412437 RepID=A0ABP3NSP6_9GAMM|nr:hypothetical protein [Rheinheimera aquimaris]MCB5213591.1 hypothetical protein [Rheinheimera aquimaris]
MKKLFWAALLLITVPLIDSLFLGNAFGINWHSPKLMYQVSVYLVPIKLLLTITGIVLLLKIPAQGWAKAGKYSVVTVGVLHCCLLALICLAYLVFGDKTKFYQENGNIHLYTADTGAMGKSYHYFDFICRGKFGFFTPIPISREDWLGQFSFEQSGNQLVIRQLNNDETNVITRDIPTNSCK